MTIQALYQSKIRKIGDFLDLLHPVDSMVTSIAAGQPRTLLNALSGKKDFEKWTLFTGLSAFPYPILMDPRLESASGYYGPIERMVNEAGGNMAYIPLSFDAFNHYVHASKPRVVMTTLSSMNEEGYFSFGLNAEAICESAIEAAKDPDRIVVAEVNSQMPFVEGIKELGGNKIHLDQIDFLIESDQSLLELPSSEVSEVEKKIAENVVELIRSGDTLQFGIGGIPNHVATLLAESAKGDFGIHSEMISDGFLKLVESGKITNQQKGINPGNSIFTFALGSKRLYDWLDERNGKNSLRALAAPVTYVNDPAQISKNKNMVSINSGLMIDFAGQVCSEAIGEKQYSGVGGQLNFVQGAFFSPGGRVILCIKSSAMINGELFSNIVESFPSGSIVSTPRHYVQWIVTEYGALNLYGLSDEERPWALIEIAHPQFRETLKEEAKKRNQKYYFRKV